jgi:hypothetical protein
MSKPLTSSTQIGNVFLSSSSTLGSFFQLIGVPATTEQATLIVLVRDSALNAVQVDELSVRQNGNSVGYSFDFASLGMSGLGIWAVNVPTGTTEVGAVSKATTLDTAEITAIQGQMTFVLLTATDSSLQPIGVAAVTISSPASVLNLGDALDVSVSLTGPATAGTALHAIFYQALVGRYSPIDQSVFVFAPIEVAAGNTTASFQVKYQNLSTPGTYVISIVTADKASQVADITQLPVTTFASFVIQGDISGAPSTQTSSGQTQPTWDLAALASARQDITVGDQPFSLAFDGTNIWAINQGSVSAVSADGFLLGPPFSVGTPTAAASGGTPVAPIMWVASSNGYQGSLTALGPSPPRPIGQPFSVVQQPSALAAIQDPEMGVVIYFVELNSDGLFAFLPTMGRVAPIGKTGTVGSQVLLFDGTNFWICDAFNNTVSKVDKNSGASVTFAVGNGPNGLAFDANSIWVTNFNDNTISKLSVNDGQILQTIATGLNPGGIAFDGANLWVANRGSNTLTQIRASDGMVLGNLPTGLNPAAVLFDGTHLWVANSGTNTISKY